VACMRSLSRVICAGLMPWMLRPMAVCWPAMSGSVLESHWLLPPARKPPTPVGSLPAASAPPSAWIWPSSKIWGLRWMPAGMVRGSCAGVGDACGDKRFNGLVIRVAGGHPGEGDFFAGYCCRGYLPIEQRTAAPDGCRLILVDRVPELRPFGLGNFAELFGTCPHGVGQGAGQIRQRVDFCGFRAQHVAHGAAAPVLAGDMALQLVLIMPDLVFNGRAIEVSCPAFCLVDFCPAPGGVEEGVGVKGHSRLQIHALGVGVLLEAGIHGHPGVGLALAWPVRGTSAGVVLDEGLDPDVFQTKGKVLASPGEDGVGHTANPVLYLPQGNFYAAVDVAGRDARASEQGNQQAVGVEGVAMLFVQGVLRALHAAVAGEVVDVVVHPLVDCVRVLPRLWARALISPMWGVTALVWKASPALVSGARARDSCATSMVRRGLTRAGAFC